MDAISEIIVSAVDKVKNAVVKIDLLQKNGSKNVLSGSGSGFIFSSDGLLFTNAHVIQKFSGIRITLLDGQTYNAEIIGKDRDTDIAILKVYGEGYSFARLGTPANLKIGEFVIAIGNPLGYQHSVSVGVLSGIGRTMRSPTGQLIDNLLQSDTSLNPGNSGGPLINTQGEVIGINTAIIRGAQGLSFSINIDAAKEVAEQLITEGKVTKAYLGLMIQEIELHPRVKNFYKIQSDKGLMIIGMEDSSPAAQAQLNEGDIIIEFDNKKMTVSSDLFKSLHKSLIFKPTKIKILRRNKIKETDIFPVERPAT